MDLLSQIRNKVASNPDWKGARGIESVLTHIEIAERHHERAKTDRDEHLFTDVIYRTNHAFEGILKEAYVLLAGQPADNKSPYEIEEYLLANNALRLRVIDQLKNYRQNWRNPSTHDYQLFFSEQESFLAIVSVSAFVSILLDQMLERLAYLNKSKALERAGRLARDRIKDFDTLPTIDKVWRLLASFADHYVKNFQEMSAHSRAETTAQLAAFIERVAPELSVEQDVHKIVGDQPLSFDLTISEGSTQVAVETREPRSANVSEAHSASNAAMSQFEQYLRIANLTDGVLFFLPAGPNEVPVATTNSSSWPEDLHLREVYGEDADVVEGWMAEEAPVSLVDE